MPEPYVDLIIPVHSATRPIARAVSSVLDHTQSDVRVNVVAHNIDPEIICSNLGSLAQDPRVRLLPFEDGIRSPAGPMNHGLDQATGGFVMVMGSDDELAPGAIDSWVRLQTETGATTVLAKIRMVGRSDDPYPPVRRGRRQRKLNAVRDRLAYRSAPLGLIDRTRFAELRFTEGLASGEDLAYSATLWFTGSDIAYDLYGPAYLVNDDAHDRVTSDVRRVEDDFAFLDAIEAHPWFSRLRPSERTAIAVKILRVHFFDAALARLKSPEGLLAHQNDLRAVLTRLVSWSPQSLPLLSRADRAVIDAVLSKSPHTDSILVLLDARWHYKSFNATLPRNVLLALHPQGPFRTLFAGMRAMNARR